MTEKPGSPIAGRDAAEIVAEQTERGPERILDFCIRTGPWGDGYGANPEGLTLAKVAAEPNGLDIGPLEPRVREILETPSGKIELAPGYITNDLGRLKERLDRTDDGLVLVSRRHVRSNNSWMHNVPSLMTGKDRCTLEINPVGARLSVASQHVGVCNNILAPGELVDVISGNAVLNGIPVEVVPA